MIYNLQDLLKQRTSDTAVYLGSGESINEISLEQWKIIEKYNSFGINNWHYHNFIPTFFSAEVKSYNRDLWKRRQLQRLPEYKSVKYICSSNKNMPEFINYKIFDVYVYDMIKLGDERIPVPNHKINTNPEPNILTCVGGVSISILLELYFRMKYKRIIMLGSDMTTGNYFWTGKPEFGEVHEQTNKAREGKDPNLPHNTAHMKSYIINYSKKYIPIYICTKKTLLYPEIPYLPIEEL
jgi:hypothetical protein